MLTLKFKRKNKKLNKIRKSKYSRKSKKHLRKSKKHLRKSRKMSGGNPVVNLLRSGEDSIKNVVNTFKGQSLGYSSFPGDQPIGNSKVL